MKQGLVKKFTEKIKDILEGKIVLEGNFRYGCLPLNFEKQLTKLPGGYCQVEINGRDGSALYINKMNQSFEYDFVGEITEQVNNFRYGTIKLKCTPYAKKERIAISEAEAKAAEERWLLSQLDAA